MVRSFKAFEHIDNNFGASLGGKVVQQSVDGVNTATAVTASRVACASNRYSVTRGRRSTAYRTVFLSSARSGEERV